MRIELRPNATDHEMIEIVKIVGKHTCVWAVVQSDLFYDASFRKSLDDGKPVVVELREVEE